jgi:hypothetical protein
MLRLCAIAALVSLPLRAGVPPLDEALSHLYNFDFSSAHRVLDVYIAEHPQEALGHAFRASAYLFYELDRLGILESEFLTDDDRIIEKKKPAVPDPVVRTRFLKALDEAQRLGEAALKADPNDRSALFAMSVAGGLATDYMALVEKRQISSLTPARRSNGYAQRLLKLDPTFYDAYLTAGFSEYMVGSLPFFIRWFVHFDNVSGSKDRGKENLVVAASGGRYLKAFAKILLGIINLREKKPHAAQKMLADLSQEYPENPLFRKELLKLNGKLGIAAN